MHLTGTVADHDLDTRRTQADTPVGSFVTAKKSECFPANKDCTFNFLSTPWRLLVPCAGSPATVRAPSLRLSVAHTPRAPNGELSSFLKETLLRPGKTGVAFGYFLNPPPVVNRLKVTKGNCP